MQHSFSKVIVHPLVLLSAVDHYRRMDQPRVVGTLLGVVKNGVVHITNSYAVPFDELETNKDVWFFDTSYNENMFKLFRKVNSVEQIVGWYHTSSHLQKNDLQITQTFQAYTKDPVLAVIDAENSQAGSPVKCYRLERESHCSTASTRFVFSHVPFEIEAEEAEEVGVQQLIEDIKDANMGDLENKIQRTVFALSELVSGLGVIEKYLLEVENGERKYNAGTMQSIQELMNSIPRRIPAAMREHVQEAEANGYICASVRSVVLLNDAKG